MLTNKVEQKELHHEQGCEGDGILALSVHLARLSPVGHVQHADARQLLR